MFVARIKHKAQQDESVSCGKSQKTVSFSMNLEFLTAYSWNNKTSVNQNTNQLIHSNSKIKLKSGKI